MIARLLAVKQLDRNVRRRADHPRTSVGMSAAPERFEQQEELLGAHGRQPGLASQSIVTARLKFNHSKRCAAYDKPNQIGHVSKPGINRISIPYRNATVWTAPRLRLLHRHIG
jgi:hypothetical protein